MTTTAMTRRTQQTGAVGSAVEGLPNSHRTCRLRSHDAADESSVTAVEVAGPGAPGPVAAAEEEEGEGAG